MNKINLTDPAVARRLKIKHLQQRLLHIIAAASALQHDLAQAADKEGYDALDDISREYLAGAIKGHCQQCRYRSRRPGRLHQRHTAGFWRMAGWIRGWQGWNA